MNFNEALAGDVDVAVHNPAADTAAVVTVTAPTTPGRVIYFYGCILSASAAPGAAVAATITGTGQTQTMRLPASATAPIVMLMGGHPLKCLAGTDLVVTLPALGGTTVGSVIVYYRIGSA